MEPVILSGGMYTTVVNFTELYGTDARLVQYILDIMAAAGTVKDGALYIRGRYNAAQVERAIQHAVT